MARKTSTPAVAAVAPAAPSQSQASLAQIRAQQKALREQAKAIKAKSDGELRAIALDVEQGLWQLDIAPGAEKRMAADGVRDYLFNADAKRFQHNGVWYKTGAIFALRDTDQTTA